GQGEATGEGNGRGRRILAAREERDHRALEAQEAKQMTAPIIEMERLTKSYGGKRGIVDVSLEVGEGEVFGFLGPIGAGKTTTIRILMALLRADSGSARIAGLDCWEGSIDVRSEERRVGREGR